MDRAASVQLLVIAMLLASSAAVVAASPGGVRELDQGKVAHFSFDGRYQNGSTVRDVSGNGNHGVFVGGSDGEPDGSAGGMAFSEGPDHVRVRFDESRLADEFTITARVRNRPQDDYAGIVTSEKWRLVAAYDRYEFIDDTAVVNVRAAGHRLSRWHHLTVVHRDDTIRLYVDGSLVDTVSGSGDLSTDEVLIGRRPGGYQYAGRIADVRIYERALTVEEVRGTFAGRHRIRPAFYSDAFRAVAPFWLLLIAVDLAMVEAQHQS